MQHDPRAQATTATYEQPRMVMDLSMEARGAFMMRVFTNLLGALIAFTLIEVGVFKLGWHVPITEFILGLGMLPYLGLFMVAGWIGSRASHGAQSLTGQYLALCFYVLAEALLFVPLLTIADSYASTRSGSGVGVIASAAYVSLAGFSGLAAIAIFSRKDFSVLGAGLKWGGFCALGLIVASVLMGFQLGLMFSVGMVAFAGAAILYDTQRIFQEYPEDRAVGASLRLFASIALLFWYVLQIFMSRD